NKKVELNLTVTTTTIFPHSKEKTYFDFIREFDGYFPSKVSINKMYGNGSYSFDEHHFEELLRYVSDVINHNCDNNAETIIFIISNPRNILIREDIRNTYGKNHVKYKYKLNSKNLNSSKISHCFLFSIGYINDLLVNQQVDYEAFNTCNR
ncbi:hypothetical protein HZS_1216, partial [Henneguya salminicola]